jgi:hypothetical protein
MGRISQAHASTEYLPSLVADFVRKAHSNRPVPFLSYCNPRPNVISHPLPTLALSYGSEDAKTTLEPVIEAMCDLNGLMLSVIGGLNTINDRLRTIDRKVAVEFDHRVSGSTRSDP